MNRSTRYSGSMWIVLACCAVATACKPAAHRAEPVGKQRPATETPSRAANLPDEPQPAPVGDPFALPEDAPIDPAEEEEALRHNCCDEMTVDEIEAHRSDGDQPPRARSHRDPRAGARP